MRSTRPICCSATPGFHSAKQAALSGETYFDRGSARAALADCTLPAYFMDFETHQFAASIWKGTRPCQMIPFQYSSAVCCAGAEAASVGRTRSALASNRSRSLLSPITNGVLEHQTKRYCQRHDRMIRH
ncbi:DUF2779 domain-containing protein [Pseudoxanthomonas spadix]|uniref:DUF2779 domain-containing protein n=1 Tax=Pseudoxanthomonas spadix TaxID=415229 RepID=UPI003CCD1D91